MLSKCIALTSKICVHFPEVTQSKCWVSCENSTGLFILVAQRQSKVETDEMLKFFKWKIRSIRVVSLYFLDFS